MACCPTRNYGQLGGGSAIVGLHPRAVPKMAGPGSPGPGTASTGAWPPLAGPLPAPTRAEGGPARRRAQAPRLVQGPSVPALAEDTGKCRRRSRSRWGSAAPELLAAKAASAPPAQRLLSARSAQLRDRSASTRAGGPCCLGCAELLSSQRLDGPRTLADADSMGV